MKTIHTAGYRVLLDWLREQRLARGLSMRELAGRLGIAHSWIGKIETGERRLDVCEYIRLCRALECDYRDGIRRLLAAGGAYTVAERFETPSAAETGAPGRSGSRNGGTRRPFPRHP